MNFEFFFEKLCFSLESKVHFTLQHILIQMSQISNAQQLTLGYWLLQRICRIRG